MMSRPSTVRRTLLTIVCLCGWPAASCFAQQADPDSPGGSDGSTTKVIHIHHHYFGSPWANPTQMAMTPGWSAVGETMNRPWDMDLGLGFYGFIGQQGVYSGLIVTKVKPDSAAAKLGLVVGDFILSINGQATTGYSYKQLEILFVSLTTRRDVQVDFKVWNSHTRRTSDLKAKLVSDNPKIPDDE